MIAPHTINRGLVIIIPKQPAYDWENKVFPDDDLIRNIKDADEHSSYLLEEYQVYNDPKEALKKYWKFIFEDHMFGACTDENEWPQKLTWKLFTEWFEFHFSSMVIDLEKGEIIKDEY